MNKRTLSEAHEKIIDWVGTDGETIENLTDQQAKDMLKWLEENNINIERHEDVKKLKTYCDNINQP